MSAAARRFVWLVGAVLFGWLAVRLVSGIEARRRALPPGPSRPSGDLGTEIPAVAWAESVGGDCPPGYPVKVKLRSGLYHEPGMALYERTHPDRCYVDGPAAEADGFTRSQR